MNDEILDSNIASLESSSLSINVKIRTLDNEFMVNINSQNRVEELKKRIENVGKLKIIIFLIKFNKIDFKSSL
jgi:hypothetical protein